MVCSLPKQVIYERIPKYPEKHNRLFQSQYSFRKNLATRELMTKMLQTADNNEYTITGVIAQFRYILTRETGVEFYPSKRGSGEKIHRNSLTRSSRREYFNSNSILS